MLFTRPACSQLGTSMSSGRKTVSGPDKKANRKCLCSVPQQGQCVPQWQLEPLPGANGEMKGEYVAEGCDKDGLHLRETEQ